MIFQRFNLLMQRTCLQNVCFPMELSGVKQGGRRPVAPRSCWSWWACRIRHRPIRRSCPAASSSAWPLPARWLPSPKVLLCDEATSALDPNTTHQILELIRDINQKLGITVVVITHQMSVVKTICNHVAILDGGEVAEKGLVSEVFAAPKSAAGRRLVFPGGDRCAGVRPAGGAPGAVDLPGQRHHRHAAGGADWPPRRASSAR